MNEGLGKDSYRKGNSVKRFGPFTELPDLRRVLVEIHTKCSPEPGNKKTWEDKFLGIPFLAPMIP